MSESLSLINGYQRYINSVISELNKTEIQNNLIIEKGIYFNKFLNQNPLENFKKIQQVAQEIRNEYLSIMEENILIMSNLYSTLLQEVENLKFTIKNSSIPLNISFSNKLLNLNDFCKQKVVNEIKLDFHIKCQNCNFSIYDVMQFIKLASKKEAELKLIEKKHKENLVQNTVKNDSLKKIKLELNDKFLTVSEYHQILVNQIQLISNMENDTKIEIEII